MPVRSEPLRSGKPATPAGPIRVPPHPGASSADVSRRMSQAPRRDTAPELRVRRLLHAAGYRFRVVYPVPGKRRRTVDIAFTRRRLAVFIDGCFWHACPDHGRVPTANDAWWEQKLSANAARDADTNRLLTEAGWTVVRFWEHEPAEAVAAVVARVLDEGA